MPSTTITDTLDEAFRDLIAAMLRTEPATPAAPPAAKVPTQINVGRLRGALEFITANPKCWQQNVWARRNICAGYPGEPDFIGCIGYHITLLAGHRPGYVDWYGETWTVADGRHMYEAAREEIGLTLAQANELFHPTNSLEDLWGIAERITEGAITSPFRATK